MFDDDDPTYPLSWGAYVGQAAVKEQLQDAIAVSKAMGRPLEHVFLAGTSGVGKTALAQLIVREIGTSYRVHSGPVRNDDIPLLFMSLADGDVLVFDEIQRLGERRGGDQFLLSYLQDGTICSPLGVQPGPKLTVIATTMEPQKVSQAVIDRFPLQPVFAEYSAEEGALLAIEMARKILPPAGLPEPDMECAARIARACSNHPRVVKQLVTNLRAAVIAGRSGGGPSYDLTVALARTGLTEDGLDAQSQRYLASLWNHHRASPAGKQALAQLTEIKGPELERVERGLMRRGLIVLQGVGRRLTGDGITRAVQLVSS